MPSTLLSDSDKEDDMIEDNQAEYGLESDIEIDNNNHEDHEAAIFLHAAHGEKSISMWDLLGEGFAQEVVAISTFLTGLFSLSSSTNVF